MPIPSFLARWEGSGGSEPEALARELRGAKSDALRNILESLVAVGLAQEIPHEGGETRWRALR